MAKKPIPAKKIIELLARGDSAREISRKKHVAQQSVKAVRESAEEKGLGWEDVRNMDEKEVYDLIFPERAEEGLRHAPIDYEYVHTELMRDGVTILLLWEEYRDKALEDGLTPYAYATMCRGYSKFVGAKSVTSHLEHKPGQVMEVDWSGTTMLLVDRFTGEASKAHLFVATLPYSQYSYVEATANMKERAWLLCHVHAWDFFGGVAVRTVPDNLKTGVTSHPKEGEIVLNAHYEALGDHYMTAIMPTGVRKPKQKASVESTVGDIATAIVARLRNVTFHSLDDLNAAIREKLADYNAKPFQKREGSRLSVFQDVEQPFLGPLPALPFEVCDWVYGRKVAKNFHVSFDKNYYSVPYALVGRKVDLRVTDKLVEVYDAGTRVASHIRLDKGLRYKYRTDKSHMPPEFQRTEWDDVRIKSWASSIGPNTLAVVTRLFDSVPIKEQAYNPTLAVLNLTKRYANRDLEDACAYALARQPLPRCNYLKTVIASGKAKGCAAEADEREAAERERGDGYLRGASYYGGGR